jgi:sulfide:quinone oxidoreductase
MKTRVLVLGAGFGGLELTTILSTALGDRMEVTLVDKADAFVFGFSKLDVMFGRRAPDSVRHAYRDVVKPGVRVLQATVQSIDAAAKRVNTEAGVLEADVLVVALGADYDVAATPGLAEGGHEFYSVPGATALRDVLHAFERGPAIIGVCGKVYKCPPAPSETALLLHDYLAARRRRDATEITIVSPMGAPVPPSPETSAALLAAFAERGIRFVKDSTIKALDPGRKVAILSDGTELPCALFLGVPVHRVPQVVVDAGLAADPSSWVAVNRATLETSVPDVYAIGDVSGVGTPKAGVFAEGAARVAAAAILARHHGAAAPEPYTGAGSCYVEFGNGRVGRVDVDFFSGPKPTGAFSQPSQALAAEKDLFGSSRVGRWFGRKRE